MKNKINLKNYFYKLSSIFLKVKVSKSKEIGLEKAIKEVIIEIKRRKRKGKLIIIGNGGSASIASHFAIDLWKNARIKAMTFNEATLLTCISNDYGYDSVFKKPIEVFMEKEDLLFAISSSGRSRNILEGVLQAKEKKCKIITLSGFSPLNPLRKIGDINFYVPSNSYGFVELAHSIICHFIVDLISNYE